MSFCHGITFSRVLPGLANLASAHSISARIASSNPSRIPVRSQNILPSPIVAIPAQSSTLFSRQPSASAPSSMPKKTESSILAHVERLRRTRDAQAIYKTSTAFKKSVSKPAQARPTSRPASRVSSTTSTHSSASSRAARTERSVEAHIERVTKAREKKSPPSSSRPTPVSSRKVSPVLPLQIKKRPAVDLAQVSDSLVRLSVAPLVIAAPELPTLRSCLKTTAAASKRVRFIEYGGWNKHGIRCFDPATPANSFIPAPEAVILQPLHRQVGQVFPGSYQLVGNSQQIRWPPPDGEAIYRGYDSLPPTRCASCAKAASRGTSHIRYRPQQVSVWCNACMSNPARRPYFSPALDDNGQDDEEDDCPGLLHNHYPESCAYYRNGYKANVRWLYEHYPERYEACDAILNS